ncbi:MAG: hypothetical protein ACYSVY_15740 [Planctomycetota bacterium]|jgi:hypothetical protein
MNEIKLPATTLSRSTIAIHVAAVRGSIRMVERRVAEGAPTKVTQITTSYLVEDWNALVKYLTS